MPSQSKSSAAPKKQLSSENQELFDIFVINGMEIIYDENQAKSMLPRLGTNENPVKAIAELLVDIIMRITSSAKEAGKKIPPEVVLHGSNLLFGELLKVLEAAGMEALTEEQKVEIWQLASSLYIDQAIKSGEMTEQELITLSQQIKQTDEGKKILDVAKNPAESSGQILKEGVSPSPLAVPTGGGL